MGVILFLPFRIYPGGGFIHSSCVVRPDVFSPDRLGGQKRHVPLENLEEPDAFAVMARKRFISSSLRIHVEREETLGLLFSSVPSIVELRQRVVTLPSFIPLSFFLFFFLNCLFISSCYQHFITSFFDILQRSLKKYQFRGSDHSRRLFSFFSMCYFFGSFCFPFHFLLLFFSFLTQVLVQVCAYDESGSCISLAVGQLGFVWLI